VRYTWFAGSIFDGLTMAKLSGMSNSCQTVLLTYMCRSYFIM